MKIRNKIVAVMLTLCVAVSVIPTAAVAQARQPEMPRNEEVRPTRTPEGGEENVRPTKAPKPEKIVTADVPVKPTQKPEVKKETVEKIKDKVVPQKASISSIKRQKKQATLKWKKVSGVSGYEIYRATSKNGKYKKVKTITNSSKTTYVNENLKTGKKYYYKIRTYKKVNGKKVYGEYSTVKTVKVK